MKTPETPETFGRWMVLGQRSGGHGIGAICTCRCQCGVVREVPLKRLKHGSSRSCGCTRGRDVGTTLSDLKAVAGKKGGTCLSAKYLGHHIKHLWQCERGHTWKATANSVKRGSWCPACGGSRGEQLCRKVMEILFGVSFRSAFPEWLVNPNTNRRLQLDGYSAKRHIAFEYQGAQHYKEVPRFHRNPEALHTLQNRDALKAALCQQQGINLVLVPTFPDGFTIEEGIAHIRQAVNTAGLTTAGNLQNFRFTPSTRAEDYRSRVEEAADARRWSFTSDEPLSAHIKVKVTCDRGHAWHCRATDLLHRNTVCPHCREAAKRLDYRRRLKTKVENAGLALLSTGDVYSKTTVEMRCPKGHSQHWRAARVLSYPLHCSECQMTSISRR